MKSFVDDLLDGEVKIGFAGLTPEALAELDEGVADLIGRASRRSQAAVAAEFRRLEAENAHLREMLGAFGHGMTEDEG